MVGRQVTEYHVEYRIEVEADTPEDAAVLVAGILAHGGAERGVYHVRRHAAGTPRAEVAIDLDPEEDEDNTNQGDTQ